MEEWKIGEIFEYNGEWYQCVEGDICADCAFVKKHCNDSPLFKCNYRKDATSVIFKKLEKVGEPYEYFVFKKGIIQVQDYLLADPDHTVYKKIEGVYDYLDGKVVIEIKQTKEDMEEKTQLPKEENPLTRLVYNYVNGKISDKDLIESIKELPDKYPYTQNLKEFDLEAAKAGKSVCTRDGRKARIICFDMNSFNNHIIVALITEENGTESIYSYTSEGKWKETKTENDLMILPEKKEGYANIYRSQIYDTLERAKEAYKRTCNDDNYLQTIKIEWEE